MKEEKIYIHRRRTAKTENLKTLTTDFKNE